MFAMRGQVHCILTGTDQALCFLSGWYLVTWVYGCGNGYR